MKRTGINPVKWGANFLMDQGTLVEGATATLYCSGQTAMVEDADAPLGLRVDGVGDMRRQLEVTLSALDAVLDEAGMTRANIVHLTFFSTDVQAVLEHYEVYADWIGPSGVMPAQSMIGVAGLVDPDLMLEIEMTAAA